MSRPDARTGDDRDGPGDDRRRAVRTWTWLVAAGGAALIAAAAVDVIGDDGGPPAVALAFVGVFLAVGPIFFARTRALSLGANGLSFEFSQEIAQLGAPRTAQLVDSRGAGLAESANAYAAAHTVLRDERTFDARVRLQDHFVDEAAASALVQRYDAAEVRKLFASGPPVMRVLVLGLMQGDPSLADGATIESAIRESRTANEQTQGLRLARLVGPRLPAADRHRLRAAIEHDPMIEPGSERSQLRARVLGALDGADRAENAGSGGGGGPEAPDADRSADAGRDTDVEPETVAS